jgi:CRP-like cAMP-binding protein
LVRATTHGEPGAVATRRDLEDHREMLEPVEIALYLKKMPLFERLSTRNLMDIAGVVREERHRDRTALFREGDFGTSMYLIVEGGIRITRGDRHVVDLGPEEFFGELGLLEGVDRTATATTTSPVRLLRLEHDDLLALMDELPAIAIGVAQELSRRLRQTTERLLG